MKDLIIFYFLILLPAPGLYWLAKQGESSLFVLFLFLYVFVYRIVTDGNRLVKKGLITRKEVFKLFIPLWSLKYFKELYFE